jgi:hypothetical protein
MTPAPTEPPSSAYCSKEPWVATRRVQDFLTRSKSYGATGYTLERYIGEFAQFPTFAAKALALAGIHLRVAHLQPQRLPRDAQLVSDLPARAVRAACQFRRLTLELLQIRSLLVAHVGRRPFCASQPWCATACRACLPAHARDRLAVAEAHTYFCGRTTRRPADRSPSPSAKGPETAAREVTLPVLGHFDPSFNGPRITDYAPSQKHLSGHPLHRSPACGLLRIQGS